MNATQGLEAPLVLRAGTASELMAPNPVSIRDSATVEEAIVLFTDKGISGAPVIDEAGRPVGVLTHTDILAHDRELVAARLAASAGAGGASESAERLPGCASDNALVRDLMTPAVFSVLPEAPAGEVVTQMAELKVSRLFVVDRAGVLVGVIGALDVLQHLQPGA